MKVINKKNLKRTVYTVLGAFFVLLGVVGLFLPILQGILFIVLGVSLLATHNRYFENLKLHLYHRFPWAESFSYHTKHRLRRLLRSGKTPPSKKGPAGPIVYYVSAHGYGHSVRTCDIIAKLKLLHPDIPVVIRSKTAEDFFQSRLSPEAYELEPAEFDIGLIQIDSIKADLEKSRASIESLYSRRKELVKKETEWLLRKQTSLVVADIPAIPLAAAANAGIPSIAVANFSWDWIYSEFIEHDERWQAIVDAFASDYSKADLLLRLPFSAPMPAFPRQEDVGLLAEPGRKRRKEIKALTNADPGKKWVLVCFSAIHWDAAALDKIEAMSEYEFFVLPTLNYSRSNIHRLYDNFAFTDIVASVDGVLSKPGYGIMSDCIANSKPLVYAERTDFQEYHVLVENIAKYIQNTHISMDALYSADFKTALDRLWSQPKPRDRLTGGGAIQVVEHIVDMRNAN